MKPSQFALGLLSTQRQLSSGLKKHAEFRNKVKMFLKLFPTLIFSQHLCIQASPLQRGMLSTNLRKIIVF